MATYNQVRPLCQKGDRVRLCLISHRMPFEPHSPTVINHLPTFEVLADGIRVRCFKVSSCVAQGEDYLFQIGGRGISTRLEIRPGEASWS